MLHNNSFLGTPAVGLLGPGWTNYPPVIEGSYSSLLQAGAYPTAGPASAAIAQTGLVPLDAKSVRFAAQAFLGGALDLLRLYVGGQSISLLPLLTNGSYTVYGGDVSPFAGQIEELRIAALPGDLANGNFVIDSIQFSPTDVPEPGTLVVCSLGALLLLRRLRHRCTPRPPRQHCQ